MKTDEHIYVLQNTTNTYLVKLEYDSVYIIIGHIKCSRTGLYSGMGCSFSKERVACLREIVVRPATEEDIATATMNAL